MSQPPDDGQPTPSEKQLEQMLADAESAVLRLRNDLADLRTYRASPSELAAQHAEIDRLREHLFQAQVHWNQVWGFFEDVLQELRSQSTDDRVDRQPPS